MERRIDVMSRRREAEEYMVLRDKNQSLKHCVDSFRVRSDDRYAAKIEAMKDDAWRRDMRKVRWFRVFAKVRAHEAMLWIFGAAVVCWWVCYWMATRGIA